MEPRTNGAYGALQKLGGFVVTEFFEFAKNDGFAKLDGQIEYRGTNLVTTLTHFGPFHRSEAFSDRGGHALFHLLVERKVTRCALDMLHDAIASDTVKKSAQGATVGVEFSRFANQGHEDILNNFFRRPRTAGHAQGETVQRGLMATIENREGLFIALSRTPKQHVISFVVSSGDCLFS